MEPLISIITVVFNAETMIEKTIQSVIGQNYPNVEYLVIDGKSKDKTLDIVNRHATSIAQIVSEPDNGIYDAMNKGIALAHGDWVLFMNAGDSFCNPDVLTYLHLEQIEEKISVVYGDSISVYGQDYFYFPARAIETLRDSGMAFCHQAVLVRRSVLISHPFDLSYKLLADYNLFRTLFLENCKFKHVSMPICIYCLEGGLTDSNQLHCRQELAVILQQKLPLWIHFYFFVKKIIARHFRPAIQILRQYKYRKNLIPIQDISQYIY